MPADAITQEYDIQTLANPTSLVSAGLAPVGPSMSPARGGRCGAVFLRRLHGLGLATALIVAPILLIAVLFPIPTR